MGLRNSEKIILQKVGMKLTELRKSKGYTSHESFALDHDLPRTQYWRLENGRTNFTIKTLIRVLNIHDIGVEEFMLDCQKLEVKDMMPQNGLE